jgi:hypothetical protein
VRAKRRRQGIGDGLICLIPERVQPVNENYSPAPFNTALFIENRNKVAPEIWFQHAGRYVAWSPDGMEIVASGADPEELQAKLSAAGIKGGQVVESYIPGPEEEAFL